MEDWNYGVPVLRKCGHRGLIERSTLSDANYVAEYAESVLCLPCWLAERNKNA